MRAALPPKGRAGMTCKLLTIQTSPRRAEGPAASATIERAPRRRRRGCRRPRRADRAAPSITLSAMIERGPREVGIDELERDRRCPMETRLSEADGRRWASARWQFMSMALAKPLARSASLTGQILARRRARQLYLPTSPKADSHQKSLTPTLARFAASKFTCAEDGRAH